MVAGDVATVAHTIMEDEVSKLKSPGLSRRHHYGSDGIWPLPAEYIRRTGNPQTGEPVPVMTGQLTDWCFKSFEN